MYLCHDQFFHMLPNSYRGLPPSLLSGILISLEQELEKAVCSNQQSTDGLTAWAVQQAHQYQVSLADIYQVFCWVRTSLGDGKQQKADVPAGIGSFLDRAMVDVIEAFHPANQKQIMQHANDMEDLAHELAAANEEADEALIKLHMLYDASRYLGASLNMAEIMNRAVEYLMKATYAQSSAIWLDEKGFLRLAASYGWEQEEGEGTAVSLRETTCGLVIAFLRQEVLCIEAGEPWLSVFDCQLLEQLATKKLLVLPLVVSEQVLGVMTLHSHEQHLDNDVDLAKAIVQQAAIAIQNGRLYNQLHMLNHTLEQRIAYRTQELVQEKQRLDDLLHTQEIEASQKQAILSSIANGVIASDRQGKILLTNPVAEEILGWSAHHLMGRPVAEVFDVFEYSGRQKILKLLLDSYESHENVADVSEVVLETGGRVISARLSQAVTSTQEVMGMVTVLRDITREVEVDRAKSEFITTVSHELRTPMTSIKGYTELLLTHTVGPLNKEQRRFLEITRRNAERLSMLINDLLDVSRIEAGKVTLNLQEVQLQELASQVYETMLIRANEKGLDLRLEVMTKMPTITADSNRIIQVLMNLVGNAIAYTEKGHVTIFLAETNGMVQVAVKDTGIGISPVDMPYIFDRFHRSDHTVVQANSGSGLGLSIVKTFIEMHGGRIWVESEPGKGTTFTFILEIT